MSAPRSRIKTGKASLIGGVAVGIASMVLWLAVTRELGWSGAPVLALGLAVSVGVATWIRVADL